MYMRTENFDPNGTGQDNGNYFGLPFNADEARLVLLSVPWDVTASYGEGARYAPDAIIGASTQLDLYDPVNPHGWKEGIGTIGVDYSIQDRSAVFREEAKKVIKHLENGGKADDESMVRRIERINEASETLNNEVYDESISWLRKGKIVGLVGGDHSTPFGLIKALSEIEQGISVLHMDAHSDLRKAYEGFENSHASIMYNVVTKLDGVEKLVQVGIRDVCECEVEFAEGHPKIDMFPDHIIAANSFRGVTWDAQCDDIVSRLGDKVYVSFDIDGLSPDNAPNTGTPVPGGLSFNQASYLLGKIVGSGRRIVGFDLCEVSPRVDNEWDANVGARILYKLSMLALKAIK